MSLWDMAEEKLIQRLQGHFCNVLSVVAVWVLLDGFAKSVPWVFWSLVSWV